MAAIDEKEYTQSFDWRISKRVLDEAKKALYPTNG